MEVRVQRERMRERERERERERAGMGAKRTCRRRLSGSPRPTSAAPPPAGESLSSQTKTRSGQTGPEEDPGPEHRMIRFFYI
jgi:hypothetical protein